MARQRRSQRSGTMQTAAAADVSASDVLRVRRFSTRCCTMSGKVGVGGLGENEEVLRRMRFLVETDRRLEILQKASAW